MVVHPGDAGLANAAVLAARWLEEVACRAGVARMVEDAVVRVVAHLRSMVGGCDVGRAIRFGAEPQPEVWLWQQDEE